MVENFGQLAQLVEHRPYKAGATGSSPVLPTNDTDGLQIFLQPLIFCTGFGGEGRDSTVAFF